MCTYNRAPVLRLALDALVAQQTEGAFTYEIVLVNDRSSDNTAEVAAEFEARATVPLRMVMASGEGVAAARNRGKDAALGAWIAYTDDDQVNDPRWLIELWNLATANNARCVGGSVHLRFEEEPAIPLTWVTKSILGYKVNPEGIVTQYTSCPGTGSVMFHRSVFEQIGGFDNSLRWGGEDADIMLRVMNAKIDVWFTPKSVVHHLIPPYRVQESYFRWASLRVGVALAELDGKVRGKGAMTVRCLGRIAKALAVQVPMLVVSTLTGNRGDALERKCVLWRCYTYSRATAHFVAPGLFPQRGFFEGLTFRGERSVVAKTHAPETP
jgi:glycosyltransferase involved in cell wall biosynthesis